MSYIIDVNAEMQNAWAMFFGRYTAQQMTVNYSAALHNAIMSRSGRKMGGYSER